MTTPCPPPRLFLALWPGAASRSAVEAWQRAQSWPAGARVTRPQRLHVTLHFIGAVPAQRVGEIGDALPAVGGSTRLQLDRIEAWQRGTLVLTASQLPDGLARLHADLAQALKALGLPVEARRFRPHVTVARHAAGPLPTGALAEPIGWHSRGYALVASEGGRYRVLRRYA